MAGWTRYSQRNTQIKALRREGKSIPEISRLIPCSKSVVSYHCHDIKLDEHQKITLKKRSDNTYLFATAANKLRWDKEKSRARLDADNHWTELSKDPSFMLFLGLYWGEGNKRAFNVGIVNNDPGVIKVAIGWFTKFSPNTKKEIKIRWYPEQTSLNCKQYWENELKCEVTTEPKTWLGKSRRIYSKHGLCVVRFSDWRFRQMLLRWLELAGSMALWNIRV